jgi:hypothetical protein
MEYRVNFLRLKDFSNLGEDWEDVYLEVKNIRKGDVFYECERGVNYQLTALTSARRISDGWYCVAKNSSGEKVEIFVSEMTQHPGPNLFKEPQYVSEYRKKIVYIIV